MLEREIFLAEMKRIKRKQVIGSHIGTIFCLTHLMSSLTTPWVTQHRGTKCSIALSVDSAIA